MAAAAGLFISSPLVYVDIATVRKLKRAGLNGALLSGAREQMIVALLFPLLHSVLLLTCIYRLAGPMPLDIVPIAARALLTVAFSIAAVWIQRNRLKTPHP